MQSKRKGKEKKALDISQSPNLVFSRSRVVVLCSSVLCLPTNSFLAHGTLLLVYNVPRGQLPPPPPMRERVPYGTWYIMSGNFLCSKS